MTPEHEHKIDLQLQKVADALEFYCPSGYRLLMQSAYRDLKDEIDRLNKGLKLLVLTCQQCGHLARFHDPKQDGHACVQCALLEANKRQAQPTEEYWDQNSVMCGNCSVEILTRKGDISGNNGLSDPDGSEDEHLCGRCAGHQMYKYQDELEVSRKITAEVEKLLNGWSAGFESIHKLQTLVLCINREKSRI